VIASEWNDGLRLGYRPMGLLGNFCFLRDILYYAGAVFTRAVVTACE